MRPSAWVQVFVGFALIALALMAPGNVSSDGASMLQVGTSLATGRGFAVPCDSGIAGRGGDCFSTYYPLQSILAVPFIVVGRGLGSLTGAPVEYLGGFVAQMLPALAAAGVATLTAYFTILLGATRPRAILAGATTMLATEIAIYFRSFFAETLAACLTCIAVWGFLRHDRWRMVAPVAIVALILAKPQLVLVGVSLGAVFALTQHSRRPLLESVLATAVGALVYSGYNFLRFGGLTNFGGDARTYHSGAFAPEKMLEAIGLLFFSPGRGWIVYSPIVLLGIYGAWRLRRQPLALAAGAILIATLLPYIGNPGTGFNWGSRYLVPAIPLFVALAWAAPVKAWMAVGLASLGLVIAAPTFVAYYQRSFAEQVARDRAPADLYWDPSRAPIVNMWRVMPHQVKAAQMTDVRQLTNEPAASPAVAASVDEQKFFRVVAQWWWMTPAAKVPRPVGLAATLLLLLLGVVALLRAKIVGGVIGSRAH